MGKAGKIYLSSLAAVTTVALAGFGLYADASDKAAASRIVHSAPTTLRVWEGITAGSYQIGADIPAGKYRTKYKVRNCYYEISAGGKTWKNDFVTYSSTAIEVDLISGFDFTTRGCGVWERVL